MENEFDIAKIINMPKEEMFSLFGKENGVKLANSMEQGTLTYSDFEQACNSAFHEEVQANFVKNCFVSKLSKTEVFNMIEPDKQRQEQYATFIELQERSRSGEIDKKDLKILCDVAFGEDSSLSKQMQNLFVENKKVKENRIER